MEAMHIHILHIEDSPGDVALIREYLAEEKIFSCSVQQAGLLSLGREILASGNIDIVLLDLNLPDSSGIETFLRIKEKAGDIPVIVMSGMGSEEIALQAVREGAQDYLLKDRVDGSLLARSIRYAIEREKLSSELRRALARIKTLSGWLPICASCKNIRDDQGYWHQVEEYVRNHTDAEFTHGLCPACMEKLYPEYLHRDTKHDRKKGPKRGP